MVHGRPRYIVGWMPRVNGNSPGRPRSVPGSSSAMSAGVRNAGAPAMVTMLAACSAGLRFPLVRHGLRLPRCRLLVAQVVLLEGLQVVVEFVDERDRRRDVQLEDVG